MSRLDMITIGIVFVCLAALGYLVYKIVNLMNPPTETTSIEDSYTDQSAVDDSTYTTDDWGDELSDSDADADLDDDELTYSSSDDEGSSTSAGSYSDINSDLDEDAGSKMEEESGNNAATTSYSGESSASTSTGRYLVIAGSFVQRANADRQAAKLRRLGYSNTEVRIFDRGKHAVVLVDRFNRLSDANQLVRKLAEDGIESFVKEKN